VVREIYQKKTDLQTVSILFLPAFFPKKNYRLNCQAVIISKDYYLRS